MAEALGLSAAQLRDSLELCQSVTQEASQLLDECSQHLKDLDRTVQPMTARTVALTKVGVGTEARQPRVLTPQPPPAAYSVRLLSIHNGQLQARENIKKARERAEEVLGHLDASRKVGASGLGGGSCAGYRGCAGVCTVQLQQTAPSAP